MLPRRTTATITLSKYKKGRAVGAHCLVLGNAAPDVAKVGFSRIGFRGWHVANDLASVGANPHEGRVGEVVDVVPAELLCHEAIHASKTTELRQLARVAKSIREPKGARARAKFGFKEPLAVEELTNKRLAAGHVGIVFNPATTDGMELALLDFALDSLKSLGVKLLEPLVLLSLGTGKVSFGVAIHEVALAGPRSADLSLCFSKRPEPAAVNVTVTNAEDDGVLAHLIDTVRVDIGPNDFLSNLAALENGVLVVNLESIDNLHGDTQSLVLFGRVFGQLTSGVAQLPNVKEQHTGLVIDGNNVGLADSKISVWVRGRNTSLTIGSISKHAVAGHFNVNDMLLAITERFRNDPFDALSSTSQTLKRHAFL